MFMVFVLDNNYNCDPNISHFFDDSIKTVTFYRLHCISLSITENILTKHCFPSFFSL